MGFKRYYSLWKGFQICHSHFGLQYVRRNVMAHQKLRGCNVFSTKTAVQKSTIPEVQRYDYFLVMDFEATCDKPTTPEPQEIIEFPVLKVNARTFETEAVFHRYLEPFVNKELSSFCTDLTGIIQDMVNGQPHLDEVLRQFHEWMTNEQLLDEEKIVVFVTCGDWDLKTMLPTQCKYFGIEVPPYMKTWINIKKSYSEATLVWPKGLPWMLQHLKIPFQGRLHSGIDDCANIKEILKALAKKGHVFTENGKLDS